MGLGASFPCGASLAGKKQRLVFRPTVGVRIFFGLEYSKPLHIAIGKVMLDSACHHQRLVPMIRS